MYHTNYNNEISLRTYWMFVRPKTVEHGLLDDKMCCYHSVLPCHVSSLCRNLVGFSIFLVGLDRLVVESSLMIRQGPIIMA